MDDVGLPIDDDTSALPRYSAADFLIGLALVLTASVLNALGLNLTKRDHNEASKLPKPARGGFRPLAVLGMAIYVVSQLVGSSLALQYLRAQWVAPLSSTSLIANLPLARWLVGTEITRLDIIGTGVVILGVIGVVGFSNIKQAGSVDEETTLDLDSLKRLWGRSGWLSYFILLEIASVLVLWLAMVMSDVLKEREEVETENIQEETADAIMARRREARAATTFWQRTIARQRLYRRFVKAQIEMLLQRKGDVTVRKWSAFLWAVSGGTLSGQTLVYAKQVLKLLSNGQPSQFASLLPIVIVLLLAATAVAQIFCLNAGLAAYDSTLVVPVFFAFYTSTSFLTSMVGMNMFDSYSTAVLVLISFSLLVLIAGVATLSSKKPDAPVKEPPVVDRLEDGVEGDAVELNSKRLSRQDALLPNGGNETVWEVGNSSVEDEEDDVKHAHYATIDAEEDDEFGELQSPK